MFVTNRLSCLVIGLALLAYSVSCQRVNSSSQAALAISTTVPSNLQIPASVQRLAILYPRTADHELMSAYNQLDGASFQFKKQRPSLKIIDRSDLDMILNEQRLQMSGTVSDATAVHVGRILGADSVLLYHIEAPNVRERMMARMTGDLPPVVLTSKIIAVETGELLYHNVVTIPIKNIDQEASFFSINPNLQTALTHGVLRTVADLEQAFQ